MIVGREGGCNSNGGVGYGRVSARVMCDPCLHGIDSRVAEV